jgi:DNA-directed RNA polymerase subunit F
MKKEKALELRKKLEALEMLKVKDVHIAKLIDLMPENKEDVNKIFSDVGLNEDEIQKIIITIEETK